MPYYIFMILPLLKFRGYQEEAARWLDNPKVTRIVLCWGRRNGKTLWAWNMGIKKAMSEPMGVVFVYPEAKTGERDIWNAFDNNGIKFIDYIPKSLVKSKRKDTLTIELINGSIIQIVGAKDPNRLRGANNKLYFFDEFVDIPGEALEVVEPVVMANQGKIVIFSTPKLTGRSGALFKKEFDLAKKMPTRFASLRTSEGIMSADALEEARLSCIEKYGNDNWWKQEYMCDWGAVDSGSYYGDKIGLIEKRGQITTVAYDAKYPVYVALDLGMSDAMAWGYFQYVDNKIKVIGYDESSNLSLDFINQELRSQPWNGNYATIFFPHDGTVREVSDGNARVDKFKDMGWHCEVIRRESREVGIERVLDYLSISMFDKYETSNLIDKLRAYSRKFNDRTLEYTGPNHDTNSHAADMFRYLCAAVELLKGGFSAFVRGVNEFQTATTDPKAYEYVSYYDRNRFSTRPDEEDDDEEEYW